jgi:hypothetical protein
MQPRGAFSSDSIAIVSTDVKYTVSDYQILGIFKIKVVDIIYKFDIQNLNIVRIIDCNSSLITIVTCTIISRYNRQILDYDVVFLNPDYFVCVGSIDYSGSSITLNSYLFFNLQVLIVCSSPSSYCISRIGIINRCLNMVC